MPIRQATAIHPYIYSHEEITPAVGRQRDRVGEAVRLTWPDLDLNTGVLAVRHTMLDRDGLVPLHPSVTTALADYTSRRDRQGPHGGRTRCSFPTTGTPPSTKLWSTSPSGPCSHLPTAHHAWAAATCLRLCRCSERPHDLLGVFVHSPPAGTCPQRCASDSSAHIAFSRSRRVTNPTRAPASGEHIRDPLADPGTRTRDERGAAFEGEQGGQPRRRRGHSVVSAARP